MPPVAGIHLAPVYAGPSIPLCHSSIRRAPRGSVRRAVPGRSRWARVADQDQLPRVDGPRDAQQRFMSNWRATWLACRCG